MSKATEAADLLKQFFRNFEAAASLIPLLDQVGSLENSLKEKQEASDALLGQMETYKGQVAALQRDLEGARESAVKVISNAKAEAEAIVAAAKAEAREHGKLAAEAVADLQAAADAAKNEVAAKRGELQAAEAALADVQARTASALELARKTFGGEA